MSNCVAHVFLLYDIVNMKPYQDFQERLMNYFTHELYELKFCEIVLNL